jgi:hypothetical protein
MTGFQGPLIAAVLSGVAALAVGWKLGGDSQRIACQKQIAEIRRVADDLLNKQLTEIKTLQIEKAGAFAEVDKVNATTVRQFNELQALLSVDAAKRAAASVQFEKAITQAGRDARDAATRAADARKVIENVANDCARAGMPDDVVGVLNGIIGATP